MYHIVHLLPLQPTQINQVIKSVIILQVCKLCGKKRNELMTYVRKGEHAHELAACMPSMTNKQIPSDVCVSKQDKQIKWDITQCDAVNAWWTYISVMLSRICVMRTKATCAYVRVCVRFVGAASILHGWDLFQYYFIRHPAKNRWVEKWCANLKRDGVNHIIFVQYIMTCSKYISSNSNGILIII